MWTLLYEIFETVKFIGKKAIGFGASNAVIVTLKIIISITGLTQLCYLLGYVSLYGVFLGGSNSSLLDLAVKYVPFNYFSCLFIGLLYLATVAYVYTTYKLYKEGKLNKFNYFLHIVLVLPLILALSVLLIISVDIKFSYIKVYFYIYLAFLIIIVYIWLMYLLLNKSKDFIIAMYSKIKQVQSPSPPKLNLNNEQFVIYCIFIASAIALFFSFGVGVIYKANSFSGRVLKIVDIMKYDEISVGDETFSGKVIAENGNKLYISDLNRNLFIIGSSDKGWSINMVSKFIGKGEKDKKWKVNFKYNIGRKVVTYDYVIERLAGRLKGDVSYEIIFPKNENMSHAGKLTYNNKHYLIE